MKLLGGTRGRGRLHHGYPGLIALLALALSAHAYGQDHGAEQGRADWIHSDGTYETAYAAPWSETLPPDYGAFAERFSGEVRIQAVLLDLTCIGMFETDYLDAYVWSDDGGIPGEVVSMVAHYHAHGVGYWPEWTRLVINLPTAVCVGDSWWVGWRAELVYGFVINFICADLNGLGGGSPMYNVAPGLEWPEGWQPAEVRWGPTAALGIGAEVEEAPSPAESESWGAMKALFR